MNDATYRPARFWPLCLKCRAYAHPVVTLPRKMPRWRCLTCFHVFAYMPIVKPPPIRIVVLGGADNAGLYAKLLEQVRTTKGFQVITLDSFPVEMSERDVKWRLSDMAQSLHRFAVQKNLRKLKNGPSLPRSYKSTYGPQRRGRK